MESNIKDFLGKPSMGIYPTIQITNIGKVSKDSFL
jgi:hypothetical protein